MVPERYNIRVYGLCIDNLGRILVTDERRGGYLMTKFPGGGHEFGEGLEDALRREFREETETEIDVLDLFYVNDFLQISAFNPKDQLISIYYLIKLQSPLNAGVSTVLYDFPEEKGDAQAFRWITLEALDAKEFTFPIDKVVVDKINENHGYLKGLAHQGDFPAE